MKTIYIDVDTQFDFCDPAGALFVKGAPAIMDNVRALIAQATKTGDLLFGSVDSHNFSAWEFAENGGPFPPHCVKGTPGWLKMPGTLPDRAVFVPNLPKEEQIKNHSALLPEGAKAIFFEKEVYSLFANPEAENVMKTVLKAQNIDQTQTQSIVFGVATDYCVKAAALGLRERGYPVSVVTDAIAAVDEAGGQAAVEEMKAAGCQLVTTSELLGK